MGARQRSTAYKRAIKRGEVARSCGITRADNPYKISAWGLGIWWLMGYNQQIEREQIGMAEPHPNFISSKQDR